MVDDQPDPHLQRPDSRVDTLILLAGFVTLILFRLHAFGAPLESDECNYAYFSERLLSGARLYVDLWDHQPPGIYLLLVPLTAVLGVEPFAYRLGALFASAATLWLLWDVARRLAGREAGWVAAALFAVASSDPGVAGEGCNREVYMNACTVFALWWLARGTSVASVGLAGLCLGMGSLIKTVVAAHWLALVPVVLLASDRRRPMRLALFAAGPAAVWVGTAVWFTASGRWDAFFDAVFAYNLEYSATGEPWWMRWWALGYTAPFGPAAALWISGGLGLLVCLWQRGPQCGLVLALAVGSYAAVCLPGRLWPHYYLLLMPAAVLCAALLIHRVIILDRRVGLGVAVIALAALAYTQYDDYLRLPPDEIGLRRYGPRMAWVRDQARRLHDVTAPDDSIYVWSTDVGFYYYGERRCATRFTMNEPLMASGPAALRRREHMAADLEADPPRLILILARRDGRPPADELIAYIQTHRYVTAGIDAAHGLEILCDPARPIQPIDWAEP